MLSDDLTAVLQHAVDDARARRHERLTPEHLLLAILRHPVGTQILLACSVDLAAVQDGLERHLANRPGGPAVDMIQTDEFQRTLQRAAMHVQSSGGKQLTIGHVVVAMLGEREAYATFLLERAGLTRLALVMYLCHGATEHIRPAALPQARLLGRWHPRPQPTAPGLYCVMLHDDEYTTRAFVVDLLVSVFEQSAADADTLMLQVQDRGTGTLGPYSLDGATALLENATRQAREAGFPLKLTVIPATAARS